MTKTVGDKVNVYEDPITCKRFEGEAKLIKLETDDIPDRSWDNKKIERWIVEFTIEPGQHYSRLVAVE